MVDFKDPKIIAGICLCVIVVVLVIVLPIVLTKKSGGGTTGSTPATGSSGSTGSTGTTGSSGSTGSSGTTKSTGSTGSTPAAHTGTGTTSKSYGGGGGGDYDLSCASGKIVKNISGRGGWWVDQVKATCDDGQTKTAGGTGGGPVDTTDCPAGYTGADITYGQFVGKIVPKCQGAPISTPIGSAQGSGAGTTESFNCPSGQVITGVSGKAGSYVDSLKLTCK